MKEAPTRRPGLHHHERNFTMTITNDFEDLHGAAKDMVTQIEILARSVGLDLQTTDGDDDLTEVTIADYETVTDYLLRRFSGVEEIAVPHLRNLKRKAFQISRELGGVSRVEDDKGISYFRNDVLSQAFDEVFLGSLSS